MGSPDDAVVAVHTMGKVGSTSVVRALRAAGVDALHTHHLGLAGLQRQALRGRTLRRIENSRTLIGHILDGRPVKLITLVRDPIARNVSTYLASLRNAAKRDPSILAADPGALAEAFAAFDQLREPVTWWHEHLQDPLDVDVFSTPFDPAAGTVEITRPHLALLVMRTDIDDDAKARAVERFIGVDGVSVGLANSTTTGEHTEWLDSVRRRIAHEPELERWLRTAPEVTHWFGPHASP